MVSEKDAFKDFSLLRRDCATILTPRQGVNETWLCGRASAWSDRFLMVDLMSFFSHPMFHNWCTKGNGISYPVCRMVHIKEHLLLIGKSSP